MSTAVDMKVLGCFTMKDMHQDKDRSVQILMIFYQNCSSAIDIWDFDVNA